MRNSTILSIIAAAILVFSCSTAEAQIERIEDFIRTGRADAEELTRAYLEPLPSGIGGNLNTGWFNSASTHRPLGFDIQIRGALAFVPPSNQQFDISNLNLQRTSPANPAQTISPTAGGSDEQGPLVQVREGGDSEPVAEFRLPRGSGFNIVPAPMIQASVGLDKNTDVIVRYVPEVSLGSYGDFNMRGIGLKHSLSQWIPGDKLLPVDISILAGFNRIDLSANLNLEPPQPDENTNYDNQRIETSFNTFTAKLIVGKTLPFISVYGAVGYETSSMTVDVLGNYQIAGNNSELVTIEDPFSYDEDGENQYSLTGGLRFKLLFFNIFGEYTLSKYSIANAGIGFSFR